VLTNFIKEERCDVVIPLQVLECPGCLLPVIEHNIRVFAEEIPNEEIVDDAGPGTDGDVHVVSLLPEPVQVVVPVRVLRLPRRLLRQPPALRFLRLAAGGRLRGRGGGRASDEPDAASIRGSEGGVGVTTAAEEVGVRGGGGEGGGRHGWVWPRLAAARACD